MKTILKPMILGVAILFAASTTASAVVPIVNSWTGTQAIPDNNASGVAFAFNVSAPGPLVITNVTVDLNIAGGWDGDLYAYLSHGSGFSVLLNRVGRTAGNPDGSSLFGMNISLADSYLTDIHNFAGAPLAGNFAPDGRNVNPFTALDTDPRNAPLGNFTGLDPNGTWTLFFADLSPLPLPTSAIQSWTVNLGVTVPEPSPAALFTLVGLLGFARRFVQKR